MKKALAIAAIVALTATSAMAYPGGFGGQGNGPCYGAGAGQGAPCGGPGFGRGGKGRGFGPGNCQGFQAQGEPVDDAGAKAKVQEYLDKNLKGFEITGVTKFERPRGNMYTVETKDSNGNLFVFRVNPFGFVRGPIIGQEVK